MDGKDSIHSLPDILLQIGAGRCLLVHGASLLRLTIYPVLAGLNVPTVSFTDFAPNPRYEEILQGVRAFRENKCDCIIAAGGGSAMDVAKCIKLFGRMEGNGENGSYLKQPYTNSGVPLIAIPTTAGSGSESTRFAVIYYEGEKQSVAHESILPDYAILDATVLSALPLYQKKFTMLDALCQGIESYWSVNSTEESKVFAARAITGIRKNMDAYLSEAPCPQDIAESVMRAANDSGRAINITQTTAAHAMCYKLTSLYRISHGHAVALCLPRVWAYMEAHPEDCVDSRGQAYLQQAFFDIAAALGCKSAEEAVRWFKDMLQRLGMDAPHTNRRDDLRTLSASVNPLRLKNNPVRLTEDVLYRLYGEIVVVDGKDAFRKTEVLS